MKKDMPQGIKQEDWRTIYNCETVEQALAVVHYCHSAMINTSHNAQIVGDPDHFIQGRFSSAIDVSKAQALKYVVKIMKDMMTTRDGTKLSLRLYITERKDLGRYDRKLMKAKPDRMVRTCWIG